MITLLQLISSLLTLLISSSRCKTLLLIGLLLLLLIHLLIVLLAIIGLRLVPGLRSASRCILVLVVMPSLPSCPVSRLISLVRHSWRCSDVAILVLGWVEEWHRSSLWLGWRKVLTRRENSWHLLGLKSAILGLGLSPRRGCLSS